MAPSGYKSLSLTADAAYALKKMTARVTGAVQTPLTASEVIILVQKYLAMQQDIDTIDFASDLSIAAERADIRID